MASSEGRTTGAQSNLRQQDLTGLDVTKLTALSPEVISRQATINIGTIGHVAHGKSTVVKAISGVQTVRFKNELERNITIKLERLSDAILKLYRERAIENEEISLFEKLLKSKKTFLSENGPVEEEQMSPPAKKKKIETKKAAEVFVIEKIIEFTVDSGKELFFVKWKGYGDNDNTWEPIEHLDNCPLVLSTFLSEMEEKYCDKLEKLKEELCFDNLLSEANLIPRIKEIENVNPTKLKQKYLLKMLSLVLLDDEDEVNIPELVQEARDIIQLYVATRKRCRQLILLKNWEEHINQVDQSKKLSVENKVDFAGPPEDFKYINQCIPGAGVEIPDEPPIGCDCEQCFCRSKSCCGMQSGFFAYTSRKRLRVAPGTPIYECNKACKCSDDCNNRVVQQGRNFKLCIFRTSNGRGWGVKTEQKIRQGQFLCQYVGEVITFDESEKRGREYDANGLTYLFDLDFNSVENPYTVDAAHLGNVSHFINHSCEPNLGVWAAWADCLDPNLPMLALFATCDIEAGEEICFDYLQKTSDADDVPTSTYSSSSDVKGADEFEPNVPSDVKLTTQDVPMSPSRRRYATQQSSASSQKNRTECKCGAISCRKYLF